MKLTDQRVQGVLRIFGTVLSGLAEEELVDAYNRLHPPRRSLRKFWKRVPSITVAEARAVLMFLRGKGFLLTEEGVEQRRYRQNPARSKITRAGVQYLSTLKAR